MNSIRTASRGPVGLVQALRKNQRLLMNFLGASVVENRGLAPHLPQIARTLLGQDLILHEPHRRWLGEMEARVYVFAHPERFVIRHAHEGTGRPGRAELGIMPESLSPRELEALKFDLEMNGQDYVAEERHDCATAPSWTADGLKARPFAMRLYVVAVDGELPRDAGRSRNVARRHAGRGDVRHGRALARCVDLLR